MLTNASYSFIYVYCTNIQTRISKLVQVCLECKRDEQTSFLRSNIKINLQAFCKKSFSFLIFVG